DRRIALTSKGGQWPPFFLGHEGRLPSPAVPRSRATKSAARQGRRPARTLRDDFRRWACANRQDLSLHATGGVSCPGKDPPKRSFSHIPALARRLPLVLRFSN